MVFPAPAERRNASASNAGFCLTFMTVGSLILLHQSRTALRRFGVVEELVVGWNHGSAHVTSASCTRE